MKKEKRLIITNKSCNKLRIDLSDYTVFFGKNNAGKSNILEGIKNELKSKCNIIYIPDNIVNAEDYCTTNNPSHFRDIISPIIKNIIVSNNRFYGSSDHLSILRSDINKETIKVTKYINDAIRSTNIKFNIYTEELSESILMSLVKTAALDGFSYDKKVNIDNIGRGTQRLIIANLIKYLGEKSKKSDKNNIILFEEPELYLHPQLKKELHQTLINLSKKDNYQVVIVTHDPYFIELSSQEESRIKIIEVYRIDGNTEVKSVGIPFYKKNFSFNQINYKIFGIDAENYHNELYGYLEGTLDILNISNGADKYIIRENPQIEKRFRTRINGTLYRNEKISICSYIRHEIYHPTYGKNKYTEDDLRGSILFLEKTIEKLNANIKNNK